MDGPIKFSPHSESVPFEPEDSGLVSDLTGPAIRELSDRVDTSASPGFTWGRSGNVPPGSYLNQEGVPSNTTGRLVPLTSGYIATIFAACEEPTTATIEIQRRDGSTFTAIASVTLTAERKRTVNLVEGASPVSLNDELAAFVSSGSVKNPGIGIVIKGST